MIPDRGPSFLCGDFFSTPGNLAGMLLMVLSTVCMASMYTAIRMVPGGMHPFEMAFFRNFFGLLILLLWHNREAPRLYRTAHLRLHLLRGALNIVAMLMFFYAVLITPLADVAALVFTTSLFASLLALLVLREPFRLHRLGTIVFGFAGALVILRPGIASVSLGPPLLVISSAILAVALLVIKVLSRTDSSHTIALYMTTITAPLALPAALPYWQWPDGVQILWLILIALLGTISQVSFTQSFRIADLTAVLPLDFLKLVWSSLLGFLVFSESPDLMTWLGATMIFSSTTYLALREARPRRNGKPSAGSGGGS